MKKKSGFLLWLLLLPGILLAQLQELEAIPVENPDRAIPVFARYPDAAAIIIKSSIPNLQFDSNIGLIADLSEPGEGEYRLIVQPMRQTLTASGPGFIQLRFNVSIAEARQVVFYEVDKQYNEVQVLFRVDPPDAKLYLDDVEIVIQSTPQPIEVGSYALSIKKEGYKTINQTIEVDPENTFFEYQLVRIDPVILTVSTEPAGAKVLLDGVEIGQTATNGVLQVFRFPAEHDLEVTLNGYLSQTIEIEIIENGENTFEFELVRNAGSLTLNVNPSDAIVELNRQRISPSMTQQLVPGMYRLEISKEGYEPIIEDVQIERGINRERIYNLEAYTGRLQFSVTPNYAQATLINTNNEPINSWVGLEVLDEVQVGAYTLRVDAEGYKSTNQTVEIFRDEVQSISINLEEGSDKLVDIDGNEYQTIQLGDQEWMAENLITTRYNDGTELSEIISNSDWVSSKYAAYTGYRQFDHNLKYGRLYNFHALDNTKNICPVAWKVPSLNDWNRLIEFLGGNNVASDKLFKPTVAADLHSSDINSSGFNGLPSGYRNEDGSFHDIHFYGYFWTIDYSERFQTLAYAIKIGEITGIIYQALYSKLNGFSVRCIKE